jgi:hypothetical protein
LGEYAMAVTDEMVAAQARWFASSGLSVGQNLLAQNATRCNPMTPRGILVSADGLEPSTHALKGHCSAN